MPNLNSKITSNDNDNYVIKLKQDYNKNKKLDNWVLYKNNKIISSKTRKAIKSKLWSQIIKEHLSLHEVNRVLIIGGGDQIISNVIKKFPSDIIIIDPCSFLYFKEPFKNILNIKEFYNFRHNTDLEIRKMVPIDMDFLEAYEDNTLNKSSFDLIICDNYESDLYNYCSIFNKEYTPLYKNLLKPGGVLAVNHLFNIVDLTSNPIDIVSYPDNVIKDIKHSNKMYRTYLSSLKNEFKYVDNYYQDDFNKIDVYKNNSLTEL